MISIPSIALAASLLLLGAPQARPATDCGAHSAGLLGALQKGHYSAATTGFDSRLTAALDSDKLRQIWQDLLPAQFGPFQQAHAATSSHANGMTVITTPLQFANGWLDMQVACNADGSVGGLFFKPGHAPSTVAPAATARVGHDVALTTPSPLGDLPGTLTLPNGDGPFPAVLLVAGSGPQDRDETIGPNKPLRDIADALAGHGIASYRYDKRSRVYGAAMAGKPITVDDEVTDDAVTAAKRLAQQPHIDSRRVFVLGHSLGALMAPRIASRDPALAGVILVSAPTALSLDVVLRQLRYLGQLAHTPASALAAELAPVIAARDVLAKADPAKPPVGQFFHAPASYWLSLRDYQPIALMQKLPQPVLILQGGSDYQVTPSDDFARWRDALADDARATLKLYPGLSHLMMPAGDPPSPADYQRPGHVDATVLADLVAWIKQHST